MLESKILFAGSFIGVFFPSVLYDLGSPQEIYPPIISKKLLIHCPCSYLFHYFQPPAPEVVLDDGRGSAFLCTWQPWWLSGKESTCDAEDLGSIPGSGRSPGGGKDSPLKYSCPGESHGQRSLAGHGPWDHKEADMPERLTLAFSFHRSSLWPL